MPRIYLCFLWHMHQPFYKDLISGQYKMPWTRLHALKDYYGMVEILREFPEIGQTFNLVPSMVAQVQEYAEGAAADPALAAALSPVEGLADSGLEWLLKNLFAGHPATMIYRYPRYGELYDAWAASGRNAERARRYFDAQAFRDVQVLSQLSWFDEFFLERDAEVKALVAKGRNYTRADQELIGSKEREILAAVVPVYREFAARGQIEISTTPFYHPILPLLCDSDIAGVSHPYLSLPGRFRYPEDARHQIERSQEYMSAVFGSTPAGLWPSEGSVSDEALSIAAGLGFQWAATDNGVLGRTLRNNVGPRETYRPYRWRQGNREISLIFRDHTLSDLIGFVYSKMGALEAARDFLNRIGENCAPILKSGRDALVPIILDGENAWEYYDRNGRPFLRELYRLASADPRIRAVRISDALEQIEPEPLDRIFPGSWINSNFDIWIGAEEDNRAWEYLLRARQTYTALADSVSAEARRLAWEELLIAEGSDWCWWYGPEHGSDYRADFDQLYRDHLANVYRALRQDPPEELSHPILKVEAVSLHLPPNGPVKATIDGKVSSYFEWLGAGTYRVDVRSGSMHGRTAVIRELHYGGDGVSLFLRIDFDPAAAESLPGMEIKLGFQTEANDAHISARLQRWRVDVFESRLAPASQTISCPTEFGYDTVLEARFSLTALGATFGRPLKLQVSMWKGGLPVDALPQDGWLEISTAEPGDWPL